MAEQQVQTSILKMLKKEFPGYWKKWSDKYQVGIPDIAGCYKGYYVAIEVKDHGKLKHVTVKQQYDIDQILRHGGFAMAADNKEMVRDALRKHFDIT